MIVGIIAIIYFLGVLASGTYYRALWHRDPNSYGPEEKYDWVHGEFGTPIKFWELFGELPYANSRETFAVNAIRISIFWPAFVAWKLAKLLWKLSNDVGAFI